MASQPLVYRHRLATRVWHWINAVTVLVMLMSGLMIFNAHPHLYWGKYGANADTPWLEITGNDKSGWVQIGKLQIYTTGVLGRWTAPDGGVRMRAFPGWMTIPTDYSLSAARRWHLAFAWLLVLPGVAFWLASAINGHFWRDLRPMWRELHPRHLWQDVTNHARLRFPTGEQARAYNVLQKLAYIILIFIILPALILTGLAMSPAMDAGWPWLLHLFGGRASARSIHFIAMTALVAFVIVHLAMVVLAGPINEIRSMLTGWYRLPRERNAAPDAETVA